jgi:hypothetical protein
MNFIPSAGGVSAGRGGFSFLGGRRSLAGWMNVLIEICPSFFLPQRGEFYYTFPAGKDWMGQKTKLRPAFFLLFYASEYLCVAALVLLVFALLLSLACLHLFLVCLYPLRRRGVRRTGWFLLLVDFLLLEVDFLLLGVDCWQLSLKIDHLGLYGDHLGLYGDHLGLYGDHLAS